MFIIRFGNHHFSGGAFHSIKFIADFADGIKDFADGITDFTDGTGMANREQLEVSGFWFNVSGS